MLPDSAPNLTKEEVFIYQSPSPLFKSKLWLEAGLVLGLFGVALALRLYNLTLRPLWLDESTDVLYAYKTSFVETLFFSQPWNAHPPLFYPTMHLWTKFFGLGEFTLRIFSVIMALATLGLLYFMLRKWLDQKLALIGLLLMALSPIQIRWAQSIRPYAWFTLLVVISMGLAMFASEKPRQNWRWLLYGLSASILIYAHYLGFHIILTQVLFFFIVLYKDRGAILRVVITLLLVAASFLPYLGSFQEQIKSGSAFYLKNEGPTQLLQTVESLSIWFLPPSYAFIGGALFLPLYVLGLNWLWKNYRKPAIWLALWSFLPIISAWSSSLIRPNFEIPLMSFCGPAFLAIVAAGIWNVRSISFRWVPYLLITLIVLLNFRSYLNYTENYIHQDWRTVVNYIVANRQEGDVIFLATPGGYTDNPFNYYYVYQLGAPGNLPERKLPYALTDELVAGVFKDARRVWMVASYDNYDNFVWATQKVKSRIPPEFNSTYYKEYPATNQGTVALSLLVKTGQ